MAAHTYSPALLDLRDPFFTGILLKLGESRNAITTHTIANRAGFSVSAVNGALQVLADEAVVMPGDTTTTGTERWVLANWGREWARIAVEREERLRVRAMGRPYHYGDARGDGSPPEEHWCDWCAGYYGVPHDITGPDDMWGTHRVGELCRNRYGNQCACIDCATLRNDSTIVTRREA